MKNAVLLTLLTAVAGFSQQQPKFEAADVHVSTTVHGFAQNVGGVLRDGRYINRDVNPCLQPLKLLGEGSLRRHDISRPCWWRVPGLNRRQTAKVPIDPTDAGDFANLILQILLRGSKASASWSMRGSIPVPRYGLTALRGRS